MILNNSNYASIHKRLAAYLIDIIILFTFFVATQPILFLIIKKYLGIKWYTSGILLETYIFLTFSFPVWLYFIFLEKSKRQATPGKKLFGFQVTDLKGQRIGLTSAVIRTVLKLLPWEIAHLAINLPSNPLIHPETGVFSSTGFQDLGNFRLGIIILVYVIVGVYLTVVFFDKKNQSIHDKFAGTLVITQNRNHFESQL